MYIGDRVIFTAPQHKHRLATIISVERYREPYEFTVQLSNGIKINCNKEDIKRYA